MKLGMIGAGVVGQTLATKLIANGHDVMLGIRKVTEGELAKPRNRAEPLATWQARTGGKVGTFAEAAAHGDIVFNVTSGTVSLAALQAAGAETLPTRCWSMCRTRSTSRKGYRPSCQRRCPKGPASAKRSRRLSRGRRW